ncbi:MAG: hypothetical protein K9J51_07835, partial [Desulfotignum sp.]|nr:hypothetical protein [Desulfotignum sp.]
MQKTDTDGSGGQTGVHGDTATFQLGVDQFFFYLNLNYIYKNLKRNKKKHMQTKQLDQMISDDYEKQDSMDIPECFGEFSKNNRLCISYCAISIRCCIMQSKHPKIG